MKQKLFALLFAGLALFGLVSGAHAASVLDTATTTAITAGWTDLKDTILAIMGIAWPFMLGIMAIMVGPKIVKR